jgi:glycosyltransferase involved in cell wall biosynthesis
MKVAVVLLTWKRLFSIQSTLNSFARQTNKDFTLVISNANLTKHGIAIIEKYAKIYKHNGRKVIVRHDGNEEYAFRRFYVGKDLYDAGYEVVLFIDDDVKVPDNYVDQCLSYYEPKTYKSGFTWVLYNRGKNYYKFRKRVFTNKVNIHYAGTGFSMIDASIFKDKALIQDAPKEAMKIEDLWLSYYVYKKQGWRMMYMHLDGVQLGGADGVALYKNVRNSEMDKAEFLRILVKMGWKIPSRLPNELA